jgi:hypothetical protein
VVATTSNGAAVMEKFGSLSPTIQQLWYNHALHLAVTKVFYIKKLKDETSKTSNSRSEYDADSEYEKDESNDSNSDNAVTADQYDLQDDVSPAIFHIRKIINCSNILQQEILFCSRK